MNQILDFLNAHVSIRQFNDRAITTEEELKIISTAMRSATSSNLHAYSIVGVRDIEKKKQLAILTGNQDHVASSSLFLVFCADLFRLKQINDQKKYDFDGNSTEMFIIATVDASLAACRALMAAQSIGIGGVMVGGIRNKPDEVSQLLKLPDMVYPVMGMSLGFPIQQGKIKPRLDLHAIYHKENYSSENFSALIKEYDKTIDDLGYLTDREINKKTYPEFKGNYSWSEHTARRMAMETRPHMKSYLQQKGFLIK